jgi:hypothetical protein
VRIELKGEFGGAGGGDTRFTTIKDIDWKSSLECDSMLSFFFPFRSLGLERACPSDAKESRAKTDEGVQSFDQEGSAHPRIPKL